jgi:hypothetical protein
VAPRDHQLVAADSGDREDEAARTSVELEVVAERAIRSLLTRWLGRFGIAGAGAAGGAGATWAVTEEPPTHPAVVEPASAPEIIVQHPPGSDAACQVSAETELMCARAVHDARAAIDYFAKLADSCELPTDARPSPGKDRRP